MSDSLQKVVCGGQMQSRFCCSTAIRSPLMLRICCCPRKREISFYSPSDISRSDWWIFFLVEVVTTLWSKIVEFHRKIILWWFLKYFWLLRLSFLFCKILPLAFYQKKTAALKTDLWNTKESKKSPKTVIDAFYNDKNLMFFLKVAQTWNYFTTENKRHLTIFMIKSYHEKKRGCFLS